MSNTMGRVSGSCGGKSGFLADTGAHYEVLGPGYTRHYHNVLVTRDKWMTHSKVDNVLYIIQELPDKRIQAAVYEFADDKSVRNPDRFTRQIIGKNIKTAANGLRKFDSSMLKYRGCAVDNLQNMVRDFQKVMFIDEVGARVRFPMELLELGLPVKCMGRTVYLNGEGFSTQPNDSIVMYFEHSTMDGIVVRYEYTKDQLHVAIYSMGADGSYRKTWSRHKTHEEARKSSEAWILWYFESAVRGLYKDRG